MAACRRMSCFAKKSKTYILRHPNFYSTGTQLKSDTGSTEIVIPYRIERGPTDILKALSSTIHKDYTAAHYKYEDDPYCIPSSNITKRSFALSKEAGKKAARYFLEKYPEFFKCNESVPHIKAFDPPLVYTEENVLDVEPLKTCIKDSELDSAVIVYDILKKKGIAVSQDLKQDLLELLCFYNSTQPPSEDYYEERFFSRTDESRRVKWNFKGMAEKLFEEMEKDGLAYSAMIAGTAKFLDAERAMDLYDEMKDKGFSGTLEAYNNLITMIPTLKEDFETRWEFSMRLLASMIADGLQPDLHTMNSVLEVLSRSSRWRKALPMSLSVLAEMRRRNIEPSLGTYHHILMIYCSFDFKNANILYDIMKEVENKEHTIRHPSDVNFFSSAMEVCWKGTGDKTLAYRIHSTLEFRDNCKLLGNAFSESQYFKNFFKCLCETEEVGKLMEIYEKYIPNTYTPEPGVTLSVVQAIHFSGAYQYLPKMCSDVLFFEQSDRNNILEVLMEAAGCMKHEEQVQTHLVQMVWNILEKLKIREEQRKLNKFDWNGVLLGNILKTFVNGSDVEKAWTVINKLRDEENYIVGYPEKNALLKFCGLCLEKSEYDKLNYVMKYAVHGAYPDFREDVKNLANEMLLEKRLSESQRAHINHMFASSTEDSSSSDSSSDEESSSSDDSSDEETSDDPPNVDNK